MEEKKKKKKKKATRHSQQSRKPCNSKVSRLLFCGSVCEVKVHAAFASLATWPQVARVGRIGCVLNRVA